MGHGPGFSDEVLETHVAMCSYVREPVLKLVAWCILEVYRSIPVQLVVSLAPALMAWKA